MASRINVYDATVSLSRLTTVLTTPSLKPTLNLPSWFPPATKDKDRVTHCLGAGSTAHATGDVVAWAGRQRGRGDRKHSQRAALYTVLRRTSIQQAHILPYAKLLCSNSGQSAFSPSHQAPCLPHSTGKERCLEDQLNHRHTVSFLEHCRSQLVLLYVWPVIPVGQHTSFLSWQEDGGVMNYSGDTCIFALFPEG